MSQKMRVSGGPTLLGGPLIDGDTRAGEERLIGGDTGLAAVMARARIVSRSGAPVLLFGETGTGKEIIARADPRALAVPERPVPPRELRRDRAGADRLGALRPRAGRVHRRASRAARAGSSRPTAARCSSTRSASSPWPRRCGCFASCRTARWSASAESGRCTSTCASSPRRTAICRRWSRRRRSARTSTTASRSFRSSSRRCATARATSARSPSTSPSAPPNRFGLRAGAGLRRRRPRAGRVSVARQRARDGGGDGPRGADRPGADAERGGRARPGHADDARQPPMRAIEGRARRHRAARRRDRRHIEAALRETHGRVEGRMARRACCGSIRTRCAPACAS